MPRLSWAAEAVLSRSGALAVASSLTSSRLDAGGDDLWALFISLMSTNRNVGFEIDHTSFLLWKIDCAPPP